MKSLALCWCKSSDRHWASNVHIAPFANCARGQVRLNFATICNACYLSKIKCHWLHNAWACSRSISAVCQWSHHITSYRAVVQVCANSHRMTISRVLRETYFFVDAVTLRPRIVIATNHAALNGVCWLRHQLRVSFVRHTLTI